MRHPPATRSRSRPLLLPARRLAVLLVVLAPACWIGCDVEWSGARFAVEKPASGEADADSAAGEAAPEVPPLPEGPFLYFVRVEDDGSALAAPAAALSPEGRLRTLELPDTLPPAWRERFDSAFHAPGRELALHAGGHRAGSLVLSGSRTVDPACPPVAAGRALVAPGRPAPSEAVAVPGAAWPAQPGDPVRSPSEDRVQTFAPILAERLLGERGIERAFLAELADLSDVPAPEGDPPGMSASYLVRDSLAPVPPTGSAVSLFFIAREDSARGFEPTWVRMHRYDSGGGKRAYAHLTSAASPEGPVHFLRLYDDSAVRLAALWPDSTGAPGEVTWEGPARCSALRLLERAAGANQAVE